MELFFVTYLYAEIVAVLMMSAIVIGLAWAEKAGKPDKEYSFPFVVAGRALLFIVITTFGLLFWDTAVKQLVFGALGYGNIMHWLGVVIVLLFIGTGAIMASAFVAPTRKALVTFGVMVFVFFFLTGVFFPANAGNFKPTDAFLDVLSYTIVAGIATQASLAIGHGIYLKTSRNPEPRRDKRLWDIRFRFKKVFNVKTIVALWALVLVDLILSFEGHGLLSWLPVNAFIAALVTGAALSVAFLIFYKRTARKWQLVAGREPPAKSGQKSG